jgi:hypothetical protein
VKKLPDKRIASSGISLSRHLGGKPRGLGLRLGQRDTKEGNLVCYAVPLTPVIALPQAI